MQFPEIESEEYQQYLFVYGHLTSPQYPFVGKITLDDGEGSFGLDGTVHPQLCPCFTGKACCVSPLQSFVFRGNMDSFRCLWHTSGTAPLALFPFSAMVTVRAFIHFRIPPVSGFAFLCSPVNKSKAASFGTNIFVMAFIVGHVFCQPDYCFRAFFFLLHTGSA